MQAVDLLPADISSDELVGKLKQAVREIAAARPDVAYDKVASAKNSMDTEGSCFYDERGVCSDGSQRCLVGQAMVQIGWPWPEDYQHRASIVSLFVVHARMPSPFHRERLKWLEEVQAWQDTGKTWGEAVALADGRCPDAK